MLFTKLKLKGLKSTSDSPKRIVKRLNAVGFVQNVTVDLEKKTVSFEYASHRDMDGVIGELRKMGLAGFKTRSAHEAIKRRRTENNS